MAIRIPWDEYETAILISACADYNAGKCTKKKAIKDVSQTLRKRAKDNGVEIDDVFRNENGIAMQFMLVNELMTQEKCGLRGASQMFINMVELYKSDRMKFQEILMAARKTVEANKTNQERFTAWLSGQLSPAQMSEIYITYYDIDKYLQEEKILVEPVLETMDLKKIESVKNMIMTNERFRFAHGAKIEKYSKAIGYYYTWLAEYCKSLESHMMSINGTVEKANIGTLEQEENSLDKDEQLEEMKEPEGKPASWAKLSEEQSKRGENSYDDNEYNQTIVEDLSAEKVPLNEEEEQLVLILKEDYKNGFRINSAIDRGRIKVFYSERFGKEIPFSDGQLLSSLKKIGVVREERIYAKQNEEQIDLLKQIFDDVMQVFENGATCVYAEAVYQKYHIELAEMVQIYNAELLGNTLIEMSTGRLRKKQTFLCLKDRQADLDRDILNVLKKSPIPMAYADIQEVMWYVPLDKIKHVLVVTKSIVQVEQETYFYSMNLPISQDEVTEVNRIIHHTLEHKSYITDVELRKLIDDNCPGIAINTSEFTTYGLRNCLGYILRDSYSFNGPIISSLDKELSMAEVFAQYCDDREQITTEELKTLASEMNTVIYWDAVRDETIRISDELLLRHDKVSFEIDEIDKILDTLCDKSYIPLKDIGFFMHFPALCVQWNGYVLESYVYKYSKKFRLLHASFSASGFFGAMVRKDSGIEDYRALIVDVLANSNQWEDKNSALELLVDQGYQQRRKYADIEKVVHEAKLLREKINAARK